MPNFSVGDRVTIVSGTEYDGASLAYNPPHGHTGEITEIDIGDSHCYNVVWDHSGNNNVYRPSDLELIRNKTITPRVSFRNWILKLDGKETEATPPQGNIIYALPDARYPAFQSFLENYWSTGEIDPDDLSGAFTWAATEQGTRFWGLIHKGEGDQREACCILDNWCDQMGIPPRASRSTTVSLPW